MHKLVRQVRFSVNPFLTEVKDGFNSYSSKPCGEGLALYFGLWIEVEGQLDKETGFVVNVVEIDKAVRKYVVPLFMERIRENFKRGEHVSLLSLVGLLRGAWRVVGNKFGQVRLCGMRLELNPFRSISIKAEDSELMYFSEKFEFAVMHTLWNDSFSEERNFEVFGKCANRAGHGHNYVIEVTVKRADDVEFAECSFEKVVEEEFVGTVDHKNLNVDVEAFAELNPTVENISKVAWGSLDGKFGASELDKITVWETDKTYCSYTGNG